ncbi:MAG TPA: hypothetical protein VG456_15055 [Candidatus Sulfopaludibacter sp.]|nr:hypothetical protein [Candidatus Sulfopaludibacter sp.]
MTPLVGQTFLFERPIRPDGVRGDQARMELLKVGPASLLFLLMGQPPLERGPHRLNHRAFEDCEITFERVIVPRREHSDPKGMYYEAKLE